MSLRLFVALDVPDAARAALAAFRDEAADPLVWRAVPDGSLHVTLAFLGHRPEPDAARAGAVLAALPAGGAPALALGAGLLLPPRRPRVLAVALADPDGALGALQASVTAGLAAAGLHRPERRPFRPHVTVGRLRTGARAPRAVAAAPDPLAFAGGALVLYRSLLGRAGAAYEPLAVRDFG